MIEDIQVTRLPNGLAALTDRMAGVRSVTLGFFFRVGARHEPAELNGISHFIEHTVFKGTGRRSALDIAVEQDRLGGNLDAFTTHEETGFAIKVVDERLDDAFDLLADMVGDPRFDEKELKSEQRVIIEEMKMIEDSPEEYLSDIFQEKFFPGHPLGLSIAGTPRTVRRFGSGVTRDYFGKVFTPANLVIAAAGNVEHDRILQLAKQHFGSGKRGRTRKPSNGRPTLAAPVVVKRNPNLEQAHIIIATPFVGAREKSRYAADLLADILGGGNSSRLWQKVREERGLAYHVGASAVMFRDCGFFSIFAGTSPKQTAEVVDIAVSEMRSLVETGVTADELELAKQQTAASVLLSLEDSASRAAALAQSEMIHGRQITVEETLAKLHAVSVGEIRSIARKFFRTEKVAFAALGDLDGLKVDRRKLTIETS